MKPKGKSAVVLLITLFFIISISTLISINLKEHEKFIDESKLETTLTQVQISSKNIESEIISLIRKYSDNIDEIIEITSNSIPFDYGNIKLNIVLDYYNIAQCNLNDINSSSPLNEQCEQDIVDNISYPYDFLELLDKYPKFKSQDQVDYFLDDYKYQTRDETIDNIKDNFAFLDTDDNKTYLECNYKMLINLDKIDGVFVFAVDGNQTKLFNLTIR
ncbi:MAG: hypothetical protein U9N59_15150 [Campylobacterota bacterium]|nr:hypothetical protein [Campylobacterota bacterium]